MADEYWRLPYSASQLQTATANQVPRINSTNKHWEVWDISTGAWVDTGVVAQGDGVFSFNSRTGAVTPQSGDYTPDMVGAVEAPSTSGSAGQVLTKTEDGTKWATPTGGVTSFNSRTGAVTPQSGDYTPDMVGAQMDMGFVEDTTYSGCFYRNVTVNNQTVKEWLNPPMVVDTEYRINERYLGKPVYVKVVDVGSITANTIKYAYPTTESVASTARVVRVYATASNSNGTRILTTPFKNDNFDFTASGLLYNSTTIRVDIKSNTDLINCVAVAYYTKE